LTKKATHIHRNNRNARTSLLDRTNQQYNTMRFTFSAVLALGTTIRSSHAFLSPTLRLRTTEIHMDQNFMDALSPPSEDENSDVDEVNEDGGQGSSRFQKMLKLAEEEQSRSASVQAAPLAIENPFLSSAPSTPAPTQLPANPDDLSVEEQARMFREMMAGNQSSASAPPQPPISSATPDRSGRPVGRNVDADKIANTSDLYFAQLKRDSTVRTIGRIRGDDEVSEAVFQDDGIKQLDSLFLSNPHLQAQKDEERALLDNLPEEVVAPYFNSDEVTEEVMASSGISYKQRMIELKQKKLGGGSIPVSTPAQKQEITEASQVEVVPPPTPPEPESKPETVIPQASTPSQAPLEPEQEAVVLQSSPTPPLPTPQQQHPPPPAPVAETPRPLTVTSSSSVRKQNLRTLMGLVLKHRGGPGFGKGRLKGSDVDLFEDLVEEITNMLRDEAKLAQPNINTSASAIVEEYSTVVTEPAPVQAATAVSQPETPVATSGSTEPANIDSTIACIEGAITMYNNSPPAIQESVLFTLRAALMSAVDTCNIVLTSQPAPPVAASPDASIKGMVACIEGAVTMYKNCPPALKESVLVTLRMALMSAVETCNIILSPGQVAPLVAAVEAPPVVQSVASIETVSSPVSPSPVLMGLDENSRALEKIYEKFQSASGDGKLGLRSDLTAGEALELADELVDMRGILMEELEAGIPDPELAIDSSQAWDNAVGQESSASSRYQQMLAKARAEKAKS